MGDRENNHLHQDEAPQGKGFPLPKGGWKYGKKIGNPYYYMKEENYVNEMTQIERRVAMQLAYTYAKDIDSMIGSVESWLKEDNIVIIGDDDLSFVSLLFNSNLLNYKKISTDQIEEHTFNPENQIVIISDSPLEEQKSSPKLSEYVKNGGTLISMNTGGNLLSNTFPGAINPKKGVSSVDKIVTLEVNELENASMSSYSKALGEELLIVRRRGIQRFDVLDTNVKVLLTEVGPIPNQPLAVTWKVGAGTIYHMITSHIVSMDAQKGTNFQGISDILELPSKETASTFLKKLETVNPEDPPLATMKSWKAAYIAGFYSPINIAKSFAVPIVSLMDLLGSLLKN